jgi:hypothetical protein
LPKPDLTAIDLAPYVGTTLGAEASAAAPQRDGSGRVRGIVLAVAAACGVFAVIAVLLARRRRAPE